VSDLFEQAARNLVAVGRRFDARGWVLGTSGNFSTVIEAAPLRLAITRSGAHKGALTQDDILEIGETAAVLRGDGVPSAETALHLEIVAARQAGAVMHTHSIWATLLSDRADGGPVTIEGYEMLKGLDGVRTHAHREAVPVLDNDQDILRLALEVRRTLLEHPACHGFLLRRHGLYTWGSTLQDAVRHVEILEFLLESVGRARDSGAPAQEAAPWHS
jgi:methylthioribulose-1-phosphate dehydratase